MGNMQSSSSPRTSTSPADDELARIFGAPRPPYTGTVAADYRRGLDRALEVTHLARCHAPNDFMRQCWLGIREGICFALSITTIEFETAYAAAHGPSTADLAGVDVDAERV